MGRKKIGKSYVESTTIPQEYYHEMIEKVDKYYKGSMSKFLREASLEKLKRMEK